MVASRVTQRYAKALFELAKEQQALDTVASDLDIIRAALDSTPEFRRMLVSPVVKSAEKAGVFEKLFAKKVSALTYNFLRLLLHKKRENLLPDLLDAFAAMLDAEHGILRGELFTAHPFTDQQVKDLKKRLDKYTGKDVVLSQTVQPELLGGFVVRLQDMVIDSSIKNQLERMREKFLHPSS
ncbi:MAG: ATP synthase F1 subunit delta [Calditrichia bacterium]